jgi:hypothetical protein
MNFIQFMHHRDTRRDSDSAIQFGLAGKCGALFDQGFKEGDWQTPDDVIRGYNACHWILTCNASEHRYR